MPDDTLPDPLTLGDLTLDVSRRCIARRVRQIDRTVTAIFDEALREHELRITQMNLLVAIQRLGEPTAHDLAELFLIERSTLSRNLARLVERGWIERRPGADRRARALVLTAAGAERLAAAYPAWRQAQRTTAERLGHEVVGVLDETARRIQSPPDRQAPMR